MNHKPRRLRRSQLAAPGASAKMLAKAAASQADHVFCDLEDSVAPKAKLEARRNVIEALNGLDWGRKVRCVRINDVNTRWCHDDIIEIVTGAPGRLDVVMLPKATHASDVVFVDLLLTQLEAKLGLSRRIGLEALIEEVEALQNVEQIALASPRLEALIFGMGDYSASQGVDVREIGAAAEYPGDIWHYARFRMTMAARAAGLDAIDGPFANFNDEPGYREQCTRARALGMTGKWAIHPAQIAPALESFTPRADDVAMARELSEAYEKATKEGIGSVNVRGVMVDAASIRILRNTLARAELIGM